MKETRCIHCGNEYRDEKEQCPTCGSRQFDEPFEELAVERIGEALSEVPRALPLREIYKGQKPPPKPLPPARPLGGGEGPGLVGNAETLVMVVVVALIGGGLFLMITGLSAWVTGQ